MQNTTYIPLPTLTHAIAARLTTAGLHEDVARTEAEIMCEADLCGVPSHGVRMLPGLLQALADGRVQQEVALTPVTDFGAVTVVDAGSGPGRAVAARAMGVAVAKAAQFGAGVCVARNTSHWGRAHAYATRAAQAGCIGLCTTNAIPSMAVGGASTRVLGNNPLAIGVPYEPMPIVLDMAMSQAAVGKVNTWLREGRAVPTHWGINEAGEPSQDASAILKGAVLPMGGHKGAALAVMFELMTAALAGGALSPAIAAADASGVDPNSNKIFIALNVAAFIPENQFAQKAAELMAYLHEAGPEFQFPGERGWRERAENLARGVPVHQEILVALHHAGVSV